VFLKAIINKETSYWVKIAITDVIHTKLGGGNKKEVLNDNKKAYTDFGNYL
jgi:hypothetical protein